MTENHVIQAAMRTLFLLLTATILTGCASHSHEIAPAPISTTRYDGWGCRKLVKESAFIQDALNRVSAEQDHAADHDTLMVFLIGVPTSGGGVKEQVADMKGQQIALHGAMVEQNCLGGN